MQKYLMVQLNLEENRPIERSMLARSLAKSLANSAFSRLRSSDCLAWRRAAFDEHLLSLSSELQLAQVGHLQDVGVCSDTPQCPIPRCKIPQCEGKRARFGPTLAWV